MVYIGIDPGKSGGAAFIYSNGQKKKVFDTDDPDALIELRKVYSTRLKSMAVIEEVFIMPGSAAKSSTSFITYYGRYLGYLEAFEIPYELVRPQKWQKIVFPKIPVKVPIPKNGTDKAIRKAKYKRKTAAKKFSLQIARSKFPDMMDRIKREKDHNRAEALLIAEYCRISYEHPEIHLPQEKVIYDW